MSMPLASFRIANTNDIDEAQSVLCRELSDLRFESVRGKNGFQFVMNGVRLGRTMLAFNRFSSESEINAGEIENAVIVSLSVGTPTILRLDDQIVGPDRLGVVAPQRTLKVHRAPDSGVVFLRTSLESVEQRYRELTGREFTGPITFERSVDLNRGIGNQLRRTLNFLIQDFRCADSMLSNPISRAGLDDLLLNAILGLPGNHSDLLHLGGGDSQATPMIVRRAEEFMEAHSTEPITISNVVAECGCSRTALFSAFRHYRGYTPLQFLTEARLKSARDELLLPSANATVASIALACGFSHLGRFAETYRKRFGETPSETIRKSRL